MATEKTVYSRIQHKHDIEANWIKASSFIPKQGEIIVYDVDENYSYERFKIGDGVKNVNDLSFASSVADWSQNSPNDLSYIKNRTHWSEPLDIEWDGEIGDRYNVTAGGTGNFIKVSDYTPPREALQNCIIYTINTSGLNEKVNPAITSMGDHIVMIGGLGAAVVYQPDTIGVFNFEESGLYFVKNSGVAFTTRLYIEEGIVHQLPEKYLPNHLHVVEDIVDFPKNLETDVENLKFLVGDIKVSDQIDQTIKNMIATNDDAIDLLIEMNAISPIAMSNNEIITNSKGQIYSL